jgi:tetratricopeptide (TPR) repeat protein
MRDLLWGLPCLVVALSIVAAACLFAEQSKRLGWVYRDAARKHLAAGRYREAVLDLERLSQLDGGQGETKFLLGMALQQAGRREEAVDLIRAVADGAGGGDPRANRWVAKRLLTDVSTPGDARRLRDLHRHLTEAERGLPKDAEVRADHARLFAALGQRREAAEKLAEAAGLDPSFGVELARMYALLGDADRARDARDRAESYLRRRVGDDPWDHRRRRLLAACLADAGRPAEAVRLLEEGMTLAPGAGFGPAAASVLVSLYDRLAARPDPDYAAMLAALREALRCNPGSPDAAVRLIGFGEPADRAGNTGSGRPDPAVAAEVTSLLESLLARGEQPPVVHMALGLRSWERGDAADAEWHFQHAYELDGSLAGVANNVAWVMSHREPPDLERALSIISTVLERWPDEPHYLDTRGEVYLRMRRWAEAVADLEKALPSLRDDPRVHRSLAEAYERLGNTGVARHHRDEAKRLEGTAATGTVPAGVPAT